MASERPRRAPRVKTAELHACTARKRRMAACVAVNRSGASSHEGVLQYPKRGPRQKRVRRLRVEGNLVTIAYVPFLAIGIQMFLNAHTRNSASDVDLPPVSWSMCA